MSKEFKGPRIGLSEKHHRMLQDVERHSPELVDTFLQVITDDAHEIAIGADMSHDVPETVIIDFTEASALYKKRNEKKKERARMDAAQDAGIVSIKALKLTRALERRGESRTEKSLGNPVIRLKKRRTIR